MVSGTRKITWTSFAIDTRKSIFAYWNNRNKSTLYSRKLNVLLKETLKLVAKSPEIALKTNLHSKNMILVRDYYIIIDITDTEIIVLDI